MVRPEKKRFVEEIKEKLQRAAGIVLTDFKGLNVHELSELRKRLKEQGIEYRVVKNTLIRIAASESNLGELEKYLEGPTALAFGFEEPISPARILLDFSREHETLKIKGGVLNGEVIDAIRFKALALLPSREELVVKLLSSLQLTLYGLVNSLSAPLRGLVMTLNALAQQKKLKLG